FTLKEKLPKQTSIYQADDGTILYFYYNFPATRLYVNWQGKEIGSKLPSPVPFDMTSFDNGLYFRTDEDGEKMYKAEFDKSGKLDISYLRDTLEYERVGYNGVCSILRDGRRFVYRMCDDPETDGILEDSSFKGLEVRWVHRGKLIYFLKSSNGAQLSLRKLGDEAILIEGPSSDVLKTSASPHYSRFLYFASDSNLFVLDTDNMSLL
ncbi:hypothetical protein PMAYCL1PPCAC_08029, partial [Pristionchus mayeri]